MDFVIRRQSEQIDSKYDENKNSDENYDYKSWEWGYLRVSRFMNILKLFIFLLCP